MFLVSRIKTRYSPKNYHQETQPIFINTDPKCSSEKFARAPVSISALLQYEIKYLCCQLNLVAVNQMMATIMLLSLTT